MADSLTYNNEVLTYSGNELSWSEPIDVVIGTQTWMIKNIDIDDGQGGIYAMQVTYDGITTTQYYYTYDAAVRIANTIQGYHLPSPAEWQTLSDYVGHSTEKVRSIFGWNNNQGTNEYGFNALPNGDYLNGTILSKGTLAAFIRSDTDGIVPTITEDGFGALLIPPTGIHAFSLRLIKD